MKTEISFEQIAEFIAEMRSCRKEELTPESTLARDLGLDGDEAYELFKSFSERFSVDLSGIQWKKHFVPEGWIMNPFLLLWPPAWREIKKRKFPIRVADLVVAANARRWIFPYENA